MARIELVDLAHSYAAAPRGAEDYALQQLTMSWRDGGAYALLGPSGCGKTTLLNIISGLVIPSRGAVLFDGKNVAHLPTERRNIAQVFQFPVIYDTMTVAENLAFPLRNRRMPRAEIATRVKEIARLLDLDRVLDRRASGVGPDLAQKISLGRGLVRPEVAAILFDEPLTVIDPHLKWELRSKLKALQRQLGVTMIYVTHDQTEALTFAEHVVVMQEGRVVQVGRPDQLFEEPAHTFVGWFIGSPGMNVLPARIEGRTAHVDGASIALARSYPDLPAASRIEIGVRPEFVQLDAGAGGVPVVLERIDDLGRRAVAKVRLGPHTLFATVPEGTPSGARSLSFDARRVHVYADGVRQEGVA
jgi:glycerol transport system ATP-binding protein